MRKMIKKLLHKGELIGEGKYNLTTTNKINK